MTRIHINDMLGSKELTRRGMQGVSGAGIPLIFPLVWGVAKVKGRRFQKRAADAGALGVAGAAALGVTGFVPLAAAAAIGVGAHALYHHSKKRWGWKW